MINQDQKANEDFASHPSSVVSWLIMGSWLYYYRIGATPILSDTTFDSMCKWLYDNFDDVEHKYKDLIKRDDLAVGSLYSLKQEDYPHSLQVIAESLARGIGNPIISERMVV